MPDRDDIPQKILLENSEEDRKNSPEGSLVQIEKDDYAQETKQKIGDFFRREIEDKTNLSVSQIDDGPELNIFDGSGAESTNGHTAKLSIGQAALARQYFETQSRSTMFDKDILPGKNGDVNTETEIQASVLLNEISINPTNIAEEVAQVISENASFYPNKKYISNPENPDEINIRENIAGTKQHFIQQELGSHGPKKLFGKLEVNEKATPALTIEQLQNLGIQILLQSSGEIFIPQDPSDTAQIIAAKASAAAVPGIARLGFKVGVNRFSAAQTIQNNVDPEIKKLELPIELTSNEKGSYGSVNNPLIPFAAISSGFSSTIAGTLLATTFSEIFILLSELLSNEFGGFVKNSPLDSISQGIPEVSDPNIDRRKRLGSYIPKEISTQSNVESLGLSLLGLNNTSLLIDTQFSYKDSLQEGVKVFFGIDNGNPLTSTLSSATRITESPGYYTGVLRSLVRAVSDPFLDIAGNVSNLIGNTDLQISGPTDVNPLIGTPGDPTNLLGIVTTIKESKFLKFMNVLAAIGDVSLKSAKIVSDVDSIQDSMENPRAGEEEEPERIINPASLHKKNRLSNEVENGFKGSLAWGSNTIRSLFFLNDKITQAESLYSPETSHYTDLSTNRNIKQTRNKRFDRTEVMLMERELDAYYVPFYFHDLRTNEIVAFHAFLENVADSYDVEYNESDGYGRIGKVYTYKNTNRNIQLSFKVVSTNPNDFSEMWLKINKLTMMLFPQYTQGRAVQFDSQKFIQPFSQIPSSSPVIRLRIGDLIKSNYSDFDLARLFGIGSESFQLSDEARQQDDEARANLRRQQGIARQSFLNYEFRSGESFLFAQSISQIGSTVPRSRTESIIRRIGESPQEFAERSREQSRQRRGRTRLPEIPVGSRARIEDSSRAAEKIYTIRFVPALPGTDGGTTYEIDFSNADSGLITPDPISVLNRARESAGTDPNGVSLDPQRFQTDSNDVRDFFNPNDRTMPGGQNVEGNPIFKAFESTRGEGLAGVIKSLSFNWEGAVWETEGLNNRAPKWCTIDITFAPIFDINPGLDSNGNMIGAPYNIGQILKQIKINRNREADMLADLIRYTAQASIGREDSNLEDGDFNPLPPGVA